MLSSFSHCYAMCGGFNLAFLRLNSATNINPPLNLAPKNFEQNPNLNSAKTAQISPLNSAQNANNRSNFTRNLAQNSAPFALILTYHSFRIIAYTLLGVIFGAFGNVLAFLNKGVLFFADCRRKIMENKGKKKSNSRNDISLDQAILQWIVDDYDIPDEKSRKIVGESGEKSKLITCKMVMDYVECMKLTGLARNTYYKYKRQIREEKTE